MGDVTLPDNYYERRGVPLMIEYPNAGSGHAGNDSSRERQEREDASGVTAETQRAALFLLEADQFRGMTAAEFEDRQGIGHGRASSALSHLHRAGHIRRLKEKRVKHEVYVLPQYVAEREESPYRPRTTRTKVIEAVAATDANKRRALALLWELEDVIYDATTERPFSDFKITYDDDGDTRIYPDQPQTDAGYAALTAIWITMLGLDTAGKDKS